MSYEVTHTRKRPRNFTELVGQEFVSATLTSSIRQGRIAHAYLFAGLFYLRDYKVIEIELIVCKPLEVANCQRVIHLTPVALILAGRETYPSTRGWKGVGQPDQLIGIIKSSGRDQF